MLELKAPVIASVLKQIRHQWNRLTTLPGTIVVPLAIGMTSVAITGGLLGVRYMGWLQPLELVAYDQLVRWRPDAPPDPRLLVVAITEADIRAEKRWPLPDQTVASLLQRLQAYQPTVIGLDLHRDIPNAPGTQALASQLQQPNVIAITKIGDTEDEGVPPPANLPDTQIGFNDILTDPDGIVRRSLLFADTETTTLYSFSLQLALAYLRDKDIRPKPGRSNPDHLQLAEAEFIPWESTSGPYQTIDARGYQGLLTYRTRRNLARQVTLSQVLKGDIDPSWVKGKVVLIGTTARSAKDDFLTPYSAGEPENPAMPGVIIHAQMVSEILSAALDGQPLVWVWSNWMESGWIGVWVGVGASLAWSIRHPLGLAAAVMLATALVLGGSYSIFLLQGWVPIATPLVGLMVAATGVVSYRAQQAHRQQQMMMKLLGQNTSPEIATALWKSRDRLLRSGKLPGQRLVATMMFTDIKEFSTISEQMPPEHLLEWLNEYLSTITQEVHANQGIINKFTGDGMLAVFGVPINRTTPIAVSQDAQLAVSCALAMGQRLTELNWDWKDRGLPIIQMRVGIFTGPIVAGSLGGKDRLEYGVIGDSVNIAARLEGYDKSRHDSSEVCRILIARETLEHLQGKFAVEHWGPVALKGKHQLVDVYRVLGYATQDSPVRVTRNKSIDGSIEAIERI